MQPSWVREAAKISRPDCYFKGRTLPDNFQLPSDVLLYYHDYPHAPTIVSSRYMLILPTVSLEYIVSGTRIRLRPGLALMVNPYLQRSVPERGKKYDRLIISFEAPDDQPYLPHKPLMRVSQTADQIISLLVNCYHRQDNAATMCETVHLLCELSRHVIGNPMPTLSPIVGQTLGLINQPLTRPLSIKLLAANVGMSASHLRKIFREEMNMSLGEYLAERRISAARHLLEDQHLSITDIAHQCGYDTIYTFSRFFKMRMKCTPSYYRKQHRQ